MKQCLTFGLVTVILFSSCKKDFNSEPQSIETPPEKVDQAPPPQNNQRYVAGEILIKFKKGTPQTGRSNALAKINGTIKEQVVTALMRESGDEEGFFVVKVPIEAMEAIGRMEGNPAIEYAEPNWIYTTGHTSNDTYYTSGSLWGMYGPSTSPANQYGSNAAAAWSAGYVGSANVYVGVIDAGIQYSHPDLSGQVWVNPYDPADGIDNDGNGYIDDIRGWDFVNNNNTIYDGGTTGDKDEHGTHVAGTIGANGGNGKGVVGVNWKVTLVSGKFIGADGTGATSNAVKAIDYITRLKTKYGLRIVATNNSWGGGGYSQSLYDAISRANNANILFVAAAGNGGSDGIGDNNDAVLRYPSCYNLPNIISVAAITSSGAKASYSNYGATTVDLGAPGSGIYSTFPYNTYSRRSGTSMATPHVTGAAALYAAAKPGTTAAQIKNAIMKSAVPTTSLNGKCVTGGRLNAYRALSY